MAGFATRTRFAGHPNRSAKTRHALRLKPDHSIGAGNECVYLHAWETGLRAKAGIRRWNTFTNHHRPHAAHGGQPPAMHYFKCIENDQQVQAVA